MRMDASSSSPSESSHQPPQAASAPPAAGQAPSGISSSERDALLQKAQRLEGKKLFVKAAEIYQKLGMNDKVAKAYEDGGAFEQAAEFYEKAGQIESAARCRKAAEEAKNPKTWLDLQADFQQDYPG